MKRWKALIALILCVALAMPAAFAAQGDAILARRDYMTGEGFQDYIEYTLAVGETLVLVGGMGAYTWKVGESDLTEYPWDEENMSGLYGYFSEENEDGEMVSTSQQVLCAYSDGESAYFVIGRQTMLESDGYYTFDGAGLSQLVLEDGKALIVPVEESEIDWEALVEYYEDESYPRSVQQCVWMDDVLYAVGYGSMDMEAYAIPTDGGYSEVLEDVPSPRAVMPYKDGKLLYLSYNYDDEDAYRFVAWDPAEEELEEICAVETENYMFPSGVTYSTENDKIYYTMQGAVIALDPGTGESEEVSDMPTDGNTALMLPGGYYVSTSYDATIVRNTDPSQKAAYRLSIYNSSYADAINSAYYDFVNLRGDVSVAISTQYQQPSQIIEAMMNRSADFDIYVLNATDAAFSSIYDRGYMAELKGSERIDALFTQMYPDIAAELTYEGVPVAVPLYCYGNSFGVNADALEKAGLTMDDIPTSWYDLLDQLDELAAKVEDKGVTLFAPWYIAKEMKYQLFSVIFEDYCAYMERTDPTMGFNTEILRSVLGKLEEVDIVALGMPEEYEDDGMNVIYREDESEVLFETYVGTTIGDFYGNYVPLLLSLTNETEAALLLNMTAAFVNPYSENKEIAIEYLECALDNVNRSQMASMCDIEIEPQRPYYYEENKEVAQQQLEDLQKQLAEAEEEEKQAFEEMIADTQRWLEDMEKNYWDIAPEAIEWYRSHDDVIALRGYNVLYSGENYEELSEYIMQYYEGEIGYEEMLKGIDKKLQMMLLEGN
ncbi:MAG: hypothetical protein IJC54_06665 [Clostridia bacterium]|nr:hypothetical protein [Clostridia bacterium]